MSQVARLAKSHLPTAGLSAFCRRAGETAGSLCFRSYSCSHLAAGSGAGPGAGAGPGGGDGPGAGAGCARSAPAGVGSVPVGPETDPLRARDAPPSPVPRSTMDHPHIELSFQPRRREYTSLSYPRQECGAPWGVLTVPACLRLASRRSLSACRKSHWSHGSYVFSVPTDSPVRGRRIVAHGEAKRNRGYTVPWEAEALVEGDGKGRSRAARFRRPLTGACASWRPLSHGFGVGFATACTMGYDPSRPSGAKHVRSPRLYAGVASQRGARLIHAHLDIPSPG